MAGLLFGLASALNGMMPCFNMLSLCSVPDYTDSAKSLFDYIGGAELEKKPLVVWHVSDTETVRNICRMQLNKGLWVLVVKKNRPLSFLLFCLSKYIADTHGLYSMIKLKNRQRSIYLTHGMPVKKFGFEYENDIQHGVQHADYALATSPFYQGVISRSMGINLPDVFPVGLPRNDVFFQDDGQGGRIEELLFERFVLYLPTYRVADERNKNNGKDLSEGKLLLGGTMDEWRELNSSLKARQTKIVIKPHPLELHRSLEPLTALSQVMVIDDKWIIQNGLSLNLIMKYSSALITDYSGAFVDYLLTGHPLVFFIPDLQEYRESRGYVFENYSEMLPGEKVTEFSGLRETLAREDVYHKQREVARAALNSQTTATASERVCAILFGK